MIKFKISAERIEQTASVNEYVGVLAGNLFYQMRLLPKMILNDNGEYVVKAQIDEDGDPLLENMDKALAMMDKINVKRFDRLRKELTEAVRLIVNPPNAGA